MLARFRLGLAARCIGNGVIEAVRRKSPGVCIGWVTGVLAHFRLGRVTGVLAHFRLGLAAGAMERCNGSGAAQVARCLH